MRGERREREREKDGEVRDTDRQTDGQTDNKIIHVFLTSIHLFLSLQFLFRLYFVSLESHIGLTLVSLQSLCISL